MVSKPFEYRSEFAREHRGQGWAEARARILACRDLEVLDKWTRKAATVASLEEFFAPA